MSAVKNPAEKKRLAYERDHYNRNGQANKAWRKIKPVKKANARRAFRKTANDLTRVCATDDAAPIAATRKQESIRQQRVSDWGSIGLRDFVEDRKERRESTIRAKKQRKARRNQSIPPFNNKANATGNA